MALAIWLVLLAAAASSAADAPPAAADDLAPAKLFDKAIENIGARVIRSGSAEIEEEAITAIGHPPVRLKYRMVLDGDDFSGSLRREYLNGSAPSNILIRGTSESGEVVSLQSNVNAATGRRAIQVSDQHFIPPTFRHFGRLAGRADNGPEQAMNSWAKLSGSIRLAGRETIDGAELYVIEIGRFDGSNRKAWIDPRRGYICPRNELYEGNRRVSKTESSGYFLEPASGLYFPEHHTDTTWNKQTGQQSIQWKYRVDPRSLKLNYAIPAEEFSMIAPHSTIVSDLRPGGRDWQATADVRLQLASGSLDLEHVAGLKATSAPRPQRATTRYLPDHFSPMAKWIVAAVAVIVTLLLAAVVWLLKLLITRTRLVE